MTMSSTFEGSEWILINWSWRKYVPYKNWVAFTLNLPIDKLKVADKQWDYFTAGVVVLGDIIHKSVPNGLEKYANTKCSLSELQNTNGSSPTKVANTAGSLHVR
jgi:hypothetical protein